MSIVVIPKNKFLQQSDFFMYQSTKSDFDISLPNWYYLHSFSQILFIFFFFSVNVCGSCSFLYLLMGEGPLVAPHAP